MSVKVMGAVFDRYPHGGGELVLALALADHAADDGRRVFPMVASLAEKTRQSERTVQRQLGKMLECGWLIRVNDGDGGRSKAAHYRISPEWLAGGEPVPPEGGGEGSEGPPEKGDRMSPFSGPENGGETLPENEAKGDITVSPFSAKERVTNGALKGDIAVSPAIGTTRTVITPQPPKGGKSRSSKSLQPEPPKQLTLQAWLQRCEEQGEKPIPPDDPIFAYCEQVGIGAEVLALHWREFKARRSAGRKRQLDWRQTFRNSVRDNWYRLWFLKPGFEAQLTTTGLQAQALARAEDGV